MTKANPEAERAVIGGVLLGVSAQTLAQLLSDIPDDAWTQAPMRCAWESVRNLNIEQAPIDESTLAADLRKRDKLAAVGGVSGLAQLTETTPTATNIRHHASLVMDAHRRRQLESMARRMADAATNPSKSAQDSYAEVASWASRGALESSHRAKRVSDILPAAINALEARQRLRTEFPGKSTGYRDLDLLLGGAKPGEFWIIAGRPSMGKTALALEIARRGQSQSLIVSLEMSTDALIDRLLCAEARADNVRYRSGRMAEADWPRLAAAVRRLQTADIWVQDSGVNTLPMLRGAMAAHAEQAPGGLVIVDYLQLLSAGYRCGSRHEEVSAIARALKEAAVEHGLCVLALAQLNRAVEQREDKRPMLSDLRESGELEQSADVVGMLYRPAYYDQEADDQTELAIRKQRNGPIGDVPLLWVPQHGRFEPVEKTQPPQSRGGM